MRRLFQFAAVLLLSGVSIGTRAQIHIERKQVQAEDLSWMWQYTKPEPDGRESELVHDPRFHSVLEHYLTASQSFWGNQNLPLAEVAAKYFGIVSGAVVAESNRYLTIYGCVPGLSMNQGMLWVDVYGPHPVVVFAATDWTTQGKESQDPDADFNLWVFSNIPLTSSHIPKSLVRSVANWNSKRPQHIESAVLVDPDGTPHKVAPETLGATPAVQPQTSVSDK
jgi:hypothetical protein